MLIINTRLEVTRDTFDGRLTVEHRDENDRLVAVKIFEDDEAIAVYDLLTNPEFKIECRMPRKVTRKDILRRNRELNEARRTRLNTEKD